MVAECKRADEGVGATIAPSSHLEKGIWALFVKAAKARQATGITIQNNYLAASKIPSVIKNEV